MAGLKYDVSRDELLPFVPASAERLLDIGCGVGKYAASLKKTRPGLELWGLEPDAANAADARASFHTLVEEPFPEGAAALPDRYFDVVTFNDVLEHMVDPAAALEAAAPLLKLGGRVIASIPNVRHRGVWWPLLRRGAWDYEDTGILDRTHLRFFTKQSMRSLFEDQGWQVESITGIKPLWHWHDPFERRRLRWLRTVLGASCDDYFYVQYVITAAPRRAS